MFNCCRLWRTKQNCEEPLLSQWLLVSQQRNFIYLHSIVQIPEGHSDLQHINLHSIIYLSAIIPLHIWCFIPMNKPCNVTQSTSRMTDNLMYNYFMLIISSNHLFQHSPDWSATQETHFLYLQWWIPITESSTQTTSTYLWIQHNPTINLLKFDAFCINVLNYYNY